MARVFIAIGSNLDPERNVRAAVRALAAQVRIVALSTFHATPPLGRPEQPGFINGVIEVETDLPARALKFDVLRCIEAELGRVRGEDRWAPRSIDLDVAIYDDLEIDEPDLHIPDPEITERPFLAGPLAELAPELVVPGTGRSAAEIAAGLDGDRMTPLGEYTQSLKEEIGA